MMLLTKANRKALPPLGSTDSQGDGAIAQVKLFHPTSRYTLYVTEFDGEDTLYGYLLSPLGPDCDEWGYSSLAEITALRAGPLRLPMERDLYFTPAPVGECVAVTA